VPAKACCFLKYREQESAEKALVACFKKLSINGRNITVGWNKNKSSSTQQSRQKPSTSFIINIYIKYKKIQTFKQIK